MAANKIVPSRTALFLLDLQVMYAKMDPKFETLIAHTASVVKEARSKGITIAHCRLAFKEAEVANIADTNPTFSPLKHDASYASKFSIDSPEAAFHPAVTPEEGDIVIRKNRVGPFFNAADDIHLIFKQRGIDTLLIGGLSTGGAVAATVVQASDLDYRLLVLEDCCADPKEETHGFFMGFFGKRGCVVGSEELIGLVE